MSNDLIPVGAPTSIDTYDDCLKAAQALQEGDEAGLRTVLARAAEMGITDLQAEVLISVLHVATGIGKRPIKAAWRIFKEKAVEEKKAAEAKEYARRAAEYAAQAQAAHDAERDRLWASCSWIALNADLLAGVELYAHKAGVVNEGSAVRGAYLVFNSRFLDGEAARLLRLGASSAGKNLPVEKTLPFIPWDAWIQISGASPKSLPYYGGDDPDALKHKIVYIPEAVILAKKPGESDNDFTVMLRTLISEGRLVYQTVVTDPASGRRETETIVKNGPIAAIFTTARDVDHELKNRVLVQDADERGEQTVAIVESALSEDDDDGLLDYQPWLDLQYWLALDAPYRVRIPFRKAILLAFKHWRPDFLKGASMRMRRDVKSFQTVIKASAVTHKAQRETDEKGRIVATIDDYRHAYEAFGEGLAAVYGKADQNVVATIKAVEDIIGDADLPVKVTLRDLAKRLRVASTATAGARLDAAIDYGAVERTDESGRGGARYYRLLMKSDDIQAKPGQGVFPPPDVVEKYISPESGDKAEQTEQKPEEAGKTRI
jgi:hypothetical protein